MTSVLRIFHPSPPRRHHSVRIRADLVRVSCHGLRDDARQSRVADAGGMDPLSTALDRPRKSRALSVKFK